MEIKKLDIAVVFLVLLLSIIFFIFFGGSLFDSSGRILQVFSEGKLYAEYNLDTLDDELTLTVNNSFGNLRLGVSKENIYVVESDCRDKLCTGRSISENGHSLVCIPNKVLICIVSEKSTQVDSVAY